MEAFDFGRERSRFQQFRLQDRFSNHDRPWPEKVSTFLMLIGSLSWTRPSPSPTSQAYSSAKNFGRRSEEVHAWRSHIHRWFACPSASARLEPTSQSDQVQWASDERIAVPRRSPQGCSMPDRKAMEATRRNFGTSRITSLSWQLRRSESNARRRAMAKKWVIVH
jgi:hypothetical protein